MRRKVAYTTRLKEGSPGEERGESAVVEAGEIRSGTEATPAGPTTTGPASQAISHSNGASVAGPVATLPPDTAIPHAGRGTDGGSSGAKGGPSPHPQNLVEPTRAGRGTDAGSSGARGGESPHPQNAAKPTKAATPLPTSKAKESRATPKKQPAGSRKTTFGERKNLGHFLGKVAKGTGRPA